MPRRLREAPSGMVFHVLNRGVGKHQIFHSEEDYLLFESLLNETQSKFPMRICAYCLMPNHWHLALWPEEDNQLQPFMKYLTATHVQRWQIKWELVGTGHLYQGRYKSFPVENNEYLLTLMRYIEANPLRAKLVERAEKWRWSSLWRRGAKTGSLHDFLSDWPITMPSNWINIVNESQNKRELKNLQLCSERGRPLGHDSWVTETAMRLGLFSTLRARGRQPRPPTQTHLLTGGVAPKNRKGV